MLQFESHVSRSAGLRQAKNPVGPGRILSLSAVMGKSSLKRFQIKIMFKMIFKLKIIQINLLAFLQCSESVVVSNDCDSYWFAFNISSFSSVLPLNPFRRGVPISPAELNSRK